MPRLGRAVKRRNLALMDTLTGIKMFLQVVELGSFVAAADRLDVSAVA